MAKTLMEQIAEDEQKLSATPETEGEEDGNESSSVAGDKPEGERESAAEAESGREGTEGDGGRGRGKRRARGASGIAPQSESGSPREDGETSSRDSSGTRKDERASREGGETGRGDDGRGSDSVDDKPPSDHAAWAKLRREKRELEAQLRAAKGEPKPVDPAKPAVKDGKPAEDAEPDRAKEPEKWRDWKDRQRDAEIEELRKFREEQTRQQEEKQVFTQAITEFNEIRDDYIKKNPDYVNAFTHGYDAYAKAIKMMRPDLTGQQIVQMVDREMLKFAGTCVAKGLNPAEELYDMAIERFGYVPNAKKSVEEVEEPEAEEVEEAPREAPRPKLKKIAETRKRSASPLMGGGQGGKGPLTKEAAANMSLGDMMNLDPSDWAELERMGAA